MSPIWFKAKRYGLGWYPCTWQGWLILLADLALVLSYILTVPADPHASTIGMTLYLVPVWIILGLLIVICWYTGETPRWRWGGK